jgi:proteic killer suppression protein
VENRGGECRDFGYEWGIASFKNKLKDHFSISVNVNWRMTFKFGGEDVVLVD